MLYRYYRIKSLVDGKTYVGKTKKTLDKRLQIHRDNLKKYLNGKSDRCGSFEIIKDKLEGVDYDIELLKEFDIETDLDSRIIEQIYIDEERIDNIACCNINNAYTSKEQKKEYNKDYRESHKDEFAEYHKKYYQDHQEELIEYQKEYRGKNKAALAEQKKIYYQDNKTAILEKKNEKFKCLLCDGRYTRSHKAVHNNSKKHQAFIQKQAQ